MKKTVCILLVFALLGSFAVFAASEKGSYTALGDSIGAGYGLAGYISDASDPEGAYASIIAKEKGLELNNLSVSGMNSTQLLSCLNLPTYSQAIKDAELITLSIGSNDILIPAMGILYTALGQDGFGFFDFSSAFGTNLTDTMQALEKIYDALTAEENRQVFESGCLTFEENWEKIISEIRRLNPDAVIAVTGYYNPYSMLDLSVGLTEVKISSYIDEYINRLNEHVKNSQLKDEYVFADVNDVTTNVRVFVLDSSMFSFDPHPDADGHALMARRLLEAIDGAEATENNTGSEPVVMLTNQAVTLDGVPVETEVYNIDGNNYFRLRDIAYMLTGTNGGFAVGYDNATRTVSITRGAAYEPDGSEMRLGQDHSATAVLSNQTVVLDGSVLELTAYNIGGSNFFKLRELGDAIGFGVDYDEQSRTVLISGG